MCVGGAGGEGLVPGLERWTQTVEVVGDVHGRETGENCGLLLQHTSTYSATKEFFVYVYLLCFIGMWSV